MEYLSSPDTVSWEITERCNLKCEHCSNAIAGNAYQPSFEDCIRVINVLRNNNVFRLNIEGGEPFVRDDLIEIIKYANSKNFYPKIDTNGTLIDSSMAKQLSKCKLRGIQVSLDGPSAQSYFEIRRSTDAFYKAIEGIKHLRSNDIRVGVSIVLMKKNVQYIEEFFSLAEELKINSIRFVDFIPTGRGQASECLTSTQLMNAYKGIMEYTQRPNHTPVIYPSKITGLLTKSNANSCLKSLNPDCQLACEAGIVLLHIRANGDITPCVYFRENCFVCGNILRDDFQSIWNHSGVLNRFRSLGNMPDKCVDCQNQINCMGGCRAYAYYKSDEKSLNCFDERCWRGECCV